MRTAYLIKFKQFDYEDDYDRDIVIVSDDQKQAETAFYIEVPHGSIGSIDIIEFIDYKGFGFDSETGERYIIQSESDYESIFNNEFLDSDDF